MLKKNILLLFLLLLISICTGCHNITKGTEKKNLVKLQTVNDNEEFHMEEKKDDEEQISIIGTDDESQHKLICSEIDKNKDIILEYSQVSTDVWYMVDDLNQNGRLELIFAINNGTALYTDFTVFEVNETFNGIQQYQFADSNTYMKDVATGEVILDSLPDIITDTVEWTMNTATNQVEYFWTDVFRTNPGEHYIGYYKVWLEDNFVYQALIAYEHNQNDKELVSKIYFDGHGDKITEEQFNELILYDSNKGKKELRWQKYQDAIIGANIQ